VPRLPLLDVVHVDVLREAGLPLLVHHQHEADHPTLALHARAAGALRLLLLADVSPQWRTIFKSEARPRVMARPGKRVTARRSAPSVMDLLADPAKAPRVFESCEVEEFIDALTMGKHGVRLSAADCLLLTVCC
jgi:hypothetical protein